MNTGESSFRKRVLHSQNLWHSLTRMLRTVPWAMRAYLPGGLDTRLAERILLAISRVNGCRYCSWFHSHVAIYHAVPMTEVETLLRGMIPERLEDGEQAALLFAIHYAETDGRFASEQKELLARHYSAAQLRGIIALCAAIQFGNLAGNTFDAFLARLRGHPDQQGSLVIELAVFLVFAPFLLPILPLL